jgi:hypothetical protein
MMTIICCKTLCEFMLELSRPDAVAVPIAMVAGTRPSTHSPTVVEMPILIRIYMPQMLQGAAQQPPLQTKAAFEPLPV